MEQRIRRETKHVVKAASFSVPFGAESAKCHPLWVLLKISSLTVTCHASCCNIVQSDEFSPQNAHASWAKSADPFVGPPAGLTVPNTRCVHNLMQLRPTKANHAIADVIIPGVTRDLTWIVSWISEGSNVLGAISKEMDMLWFKVNAFPSIPPHNLSYCLGFQRSVGILFFPPPSDSNRQEVFMALLWRANVRIFALESIQKFGRPLVTSIP